MGLVNRSSLKPGGGVWPYEIEYSALVESAMTSTGAVATDCTIHLGWKPTAATTAPLNDMTGHYLITIRKIGSAVTVWKQGTQLPAYGGSVGATYAEFIQNVLTYYAGSYYGYFSRLVVVDGNGGYTYADFIAPSEHVTGLWVPKKFTPSTFTQVETPQFTGGTAFGANMGDFSAGNAFDMNASTRWASDSSGVIGYILPAAKTIDGYSITARNDNDTYAQYETPRDFTIQGSNDGSTWDVIDTRTGIDWSSAGQKRNFTLSSPADYAQYRLVATAVYSGPVVSLAEFSGYAASSQTYGFGGCLLDFSNAADLGADASGNGNDWTVTGSPVQTLDTPTNNHCTLNPYSKAVVQGTLYVTGGNLRVYADAASYGFCYGTVMLPSSGKWYWEQVMTEQHSTGGIGSPDQPNIIRAESTFLYGEGGVSGQTGLTAIQAGDVLGICFDADSSSVQFLLNNVAHGTVVDLSVYTGDMFPLAGDWDYSYATDSTVLFGATGFTYTAPDGYLSLCIANLPDPTIKRSSRFADIVLRDGTGAVASVSTLEFQPDFINVKNRSTAFNWYNADSIRGAAHYLSTNSSSGEVSDTNALLSFDANGYSLGVNGAFNASGDLFADTCLKAGAVQGFAIRTFAHVQGVDSVLSHGFGKAVTFALVKRLDSSSNWSVFHTALGGDAYLLLNSTNAAGSASGIWATTATTFTVGGPHFATGDYVAYLFTDSDIFKAFSYTGNGLADGPFVDLGGKPLAIPFLKNSAATVNWLEHNAASGFVYYMCPNTAGTENGASGYVKPTATGFKIGNSATDWNGSGNLIVGLAILESTNKYSNAF